jgi:hypothetical protein
MLSNILLNYKEENNIFKFSSSFYNNLFNKINNIIINNDILYIDVVKKEFYNVNRDIILSRVNEEKPVNISTDLYSRKFIKDVFNNSTLNVIISNDNYNNQSNGKNDLSINIWSSYGKDKYRSEYLNYKIGYSENIFKPYYRYILPLFLYESYVSFMSYIGYNSLINKKIFSNVD